MSWRASGWTPRPERCPTVKTKLLRFILPLTLCGTAAACSGNAEAPADNGAAPTAAAARIVPLTILADGREHRFTVEAAVTPEEQAKGLMFRTELPADVGMIFPMRPPRPASFWMKNTVIPLDILFIRTDGTIALVAANTKPYSQEPVSAGTPVAGVLELRGGRAAELGIEQGDTVRWGDCSTPESPLSFCP